MSPIIGSFTGSISFNRAAMAGESIVATGGTESEWNGWKIHTFTNTGADTFQISNAPPGSTIDFIVVGGGGPGGNGLAGGGGGGGVIQEISYVAEAGSYSLNIAAASNGGADRSTSGNPNGRGNDSSLTTPGGVAMTAIGGGIGGWWDGVQGYTGGCGGGGAGGRNSDPRGRVVGGPGTAGQGMNGGWGVRYPTNNSNDHKGGGGGGAGGVGLWSSDIDGGWGGNGNAGSADGGAGMYTTIDGTPRYFGGGGGGSCWIGSSWAGNGGLGGGGGGNHQSNSSYYGRGGGTAMNNGANGAHASTGGNGGANTGGGGGASYGNGWGASSGGAGGSGCIIIRYRVKPQGEAGVPVGNLGLTEETAAESAWHIKQAWPAAPDGTYWIKPTLYNSNAPAYKVHCYMTIEGGGWELAWRCDSNPLQPGSGAVGVCNWGGWAWTTKSQIDSNLGTTYERHGDSFAMGPSYCYQSFTDCMVIANQRPDLRNGYRFANTMNPVTVQLASGGTKRANSTIFGDTKWQSSLHTRQETNRGYNAATGFGFKVYDSHHGDGCNNGLLTGGGTDNAWGWSKAQIGMYRDGSGGNHWGGGFGAAGYNCGGYTSTGGGPYQTFHGHWWGHGDGRHGTYWTGDRSNGWYGHALYVRRAAA